MNRPARKVSGDFYDYYRLDQERIAFALGDVSGKGMSAAILMAKTLGLFRCLGKRVEAPSALLQAINAELTESATHGSFVTMVVGLYWPREGRVRFANAGHQPPLWRQPGRAYQPYPAAAPPLGILPEIAPEDRDIDLAGGAFYVFSDGLTAYRQGGGEELGVDGLIQLIEIFAGEEPARRLELILETLAAESGWDLRDDLTVLAIDDSWVRKSSDREIAS
jgi:sigma-B regulation protein RsbU (phosphoserine phosphatase)